MSDQLNNPAIGRQATVIAFPERRLSPAAAEPGTAVIPIGNGALAYWPTKNGVCLCHAEGDEAIATTTRWFGPPTGTNGQGHPVWELQG